MCSGERAARDRPWLSAGRGELRVEIRQMAVGEHAARIFPGGKERRDSGRKCRIIYSG